MSCPKIQSFHNIFTHMLHAQVSYPLSTISNTMTLRHFLIILKHVWSNVYQTLTHWGRVTHIYVSELTSIGSDNGLSPGWRQAIIWNNAGLLLLIEPSGTNFSDISIGIQTFSFKKVHLNTSTAKWRPFCHGLNVFKVLLSGSSTLISSSHLAPEARIWIRLGVWSCQNPPLGTAKNWFWSHEYVKCNIGVI